MRENKQMDHAALYRRLYRLFDGVTPLSADCGALCGGACCRGDAHTGMLLFPHEQTILPVVESEGRRFVLCGGECDRRERPLSCRIFPFFPAPDAQGEIRVVVDARGTGLCPLVRHCENVRFRKTFLRRVKKAGALLYADPDCRAFLEATAGEIASVEALRARLGERDTPDEEAPPVGSDKDHN